MNGSLDRRLIYLLVVMAAGVVLRYTVLSGNSRPAVVAPVDSIPNAERRLQKLRELAATVPAKEAMLKQAAAELAVREKGVMQAETGAQAQAHLLDTIHRVAGNAGFDARGADQLTEVRPLGSDYGVVSVTESFTCGIEQLVNFLATLPEEPDIVATNDLHISGGNDKQKNIRVRLSLSGVVPKSLAPKKKGPGV
jgi:Type II secretion system (T2SS), protein M subtype b